MVAPRRINQNLEGGELRMAKWLKNRKGATMVEYALLVALIAVILTTAVSAFSTQVGTVFSTITSKLK